MTLSQLKRKIVSEKLDYFQIKHHILHDLSNHQYQELPGLNPNQKTWHLMESAKENNMPSNKLIIGVIAAVVVITTIVSLMSIGEKESIIKLQSKALRFKWHEPTKRERYEQMMDHAQNVEYDNSK